MPIYEFECGECGKRFDRLQKLSDPDPTDCPACGQAQVRRRVTAPSFRLAGSGWYETDFKKDGDKKRNLAGEGGSADKSDASKPEAAKTEPSKAEASKSASPAPAAAAAPASGGGSGPAQG